MDNYVIYHLHSSISNAVTNIDSVTKYSEYIERAKELNMTAMAFSEHGSVMAWYDKKCKIEAAGMKYIHAEEFYITERISDNNLGPPLKIRDNWHCVLIAKNWDGVREINRLTSKAFNRQDGSYYYVPRITFQDLLDTSENIIITSACLGGILNRANDMIQKRFLEFMSIHKNRCFLETQHHLVQNQIKYNLKLYELSKQYDIPLIAGTDTHCLNETHAKGRIILQKAKDINFSDEDGWDLMFKSYNELVEAYAKQNCLPKDVYLEAINNTNVMANMVEEFAMDKSIKYPHIYENPETVFKEKINSSLSKRSDLLEKYPISQIKSRVKEEFDVYKKVGAFDFMLLESYMREWEAKNDIQCGYSRGSVSGSLIAYILGITQMDSLKFDLNFFRFMNPARVTNADIDTDYCSKDRERVKEFLLKDRMDLDNIQTSEIITFNTIAKKGAIKDIGRALGMTPAETQTLSDSVNNEEDLPKEMRDKHPELCEYVDIVSGTIVSIGSHPSGVLVSDKNIVEDIGMCSLSTSPYQVSMLDMHDLDALMYTKLDVLGLDNIGIINETCKMLAIPRLTPDNVNLDDEAVWKSIRDDTTLIFQWESQSAQAYLKKFMSDETVAIAKSRIKNFSYIKWFSFGNGLIRPGCASFRDDIADGKATPTGFQELDDFLSITFYKLTMQEQIMLFCKLFCGYSDAESDNVRRAIAKKKGTADLLDEMHDRFVEYSSKEYGADKQLLERVFPPIKQGILDASSYGFSWNHSDAYSCIGYISGYLRYYHPLEFLTASFNTFVGDNEKIANITAYANKVGIKINPIKFRYSRAAYNFDKSSNSIYAGMQTIKYMNAQVSEDLYNLRDKQFDSFVSLLRVFTGDSRQLDILIRLGYFSEFGPTKTLLKTVEYYNKYQCAGNTKQFKKDALPIEAIPYIETYVIKESPKQYILDADGTDKMLRKIVASIPQEDLPLKERLAAEVEYLGYITTVIPGAEGNAYITEMESKTSNFRVKLYDLGTGETHSVKLKKKMYQIYPIEKGNIIAYKIDYEYPWKKDENGKWQQDITKEKQPLLGWYGVTTKFD